MRSQCHKFPELNDEHTPKWRVFAYSYPSGALGFNSDILFHLLKPNTLFSHLLHSFERVILQQFKISGVHHPSGFALQDPIQCFGSLSFSPVFEKQGVSMPEPWDYKRRGTSRQYLSLSPLALIMGTLL